MSHDELLAAAMQYYEKYRIASAELNELRNTFRYTADELNRTKTECGVLTIKVDSLTTENIRLQNQVNKFKKNCFGRKSEKMNGKTTVMNLMILFQRKWMKLFPHAKSRKIIIAETQKRERQKGLHANRSKKKKR